MVPRMNTADEFFKKYRAALQLGEIDASQASPLNLAYIGDCIYDLAVREYVLTHYAGSLNELNRRKTTFVCAHAQSEIMGYFIAENILTEEELHIYKRGRNQKSETHSKNSKIQEYRRATGFEALIGYLYLNHQYERVMELEAKGIQHLVHLDETIGAIRHVREDETEVLQKAAGEVMPSDEERSSDAVLPTEEE